jgi:hypothetical protein
MKKNCYLCPSLGITEVCKKCDVYQESKKDDCTLFTSKVSDCEACVSKSTCKPYVFSSAKLPELSVREDLGYTT